MKKTVVFDFDGVIHSYTSGWKGVTVILDPPVPGIAKLISKLRDSNYEVAVVSTRCASEDGKFAVMKYLDNNNIIVDKVCAEKPPAIVYIDDRALRFDGLTDNETDIINLFNQIVNFKPWTQQ